VISAPALLYALVRALKRARARRTKRGIAAAAEGGEPLPCLARLEGALARHGEERAAAEPLEVFARRILGEGAPAAAGAEARARVGKSGPDQGLARPEAAEAAELLERYAALRYGGVGDAGELERAIDRYVARIERPQATLGRMP
jgi:hypothetical protein